MRWGKQEKVMNSFRNWCRVGVRRILRQKTSRMMCAVSGDPTLLLVMSLRVFVRGKISAQDISVGRRRSAMEIRHRDF